MSGCWGSGTGAVGGFTSRSSCDALIARIERNDPTLEHCTVLPFKSFGDAELDRLSAVLEAESNVNNNTHWNSLAASGHSVSPRALERFGRALAISSNGNGQCHLQSVALGDSKMGDEGITAFCKGLAGNSSSSIVGTQSASSLTHLDFSYKGLSLAGLRALASVLSRRMDDSNSCCCPNLKSLNLSRNSFQQSDNNKSVSEDAIIFPQVQELDLSSCEIDAAVARAIFPKLFTRNTQQEYGRRNLKLDHNPLGDAGFEVLLAAADAPHQPLSSILDGLHVAQCQLTDASVEHWFSCDHHHRRQPLLHFCQTLDLSHNRLTAPGARALAEILRNDDDDRVAMPPLETINLAGNAIGEDGVRHLMRALGERQKRHASSSRGRGAAGPDHAVRHVQSLDLSETDCGVEGAVRALESCGELTYLRLYNNQLGSPGFRSLAETLRRIFTAAEEHSSKPKLHTLDLAGNGADQASVVFLLQAVLDLLLLATKDGSDDRGVVAFPLQCLVIGGNQGGEDVEAMVQKIQQIRPKMDIGRDKFKSKQ